MTREELLRSMFDENGFGLEIGPSHNPLLPKSAGYRVETVDHDSADGLRRKYASDPTVDLSRIEELNYVSGGRRLSEVITRRGEYDFVFASHVVEHLPNVLGFLLDCEKMLKPSGRLVLAVPDKRHCFDLLQQLSSAGQVLQAHFDGLTRPGLGGIFDYFAYSCRRGSHITWSIGNNEPVSIVHGLAEAKGVVDRVRERLEYVDVHLWRFMPSSFRLIMSDLRDAGFVKLREHAFHPTVGLEFYVSFSANGSGCPLDRLDLAKQVLSEMKEVPLA